MKKLRFAGNRVSSVSRGIVAMAAIIILGMVLIVNTLQGEERGLEQVFVRTAFRVVDGLDMERLRELARPAEEMHQPVFQRMSGQAQSILALMPHWSACYFTGVDEDGGFYLQLDTRTNVYPAAASPLNAELAKRTAQLRQVVENRRYAVRTVTDATGSWKTAMIPIYDPDTGGLLTIFNVDVTALAWNKMLLAKIRAPFIFTLIFMVLILLALWWSYRQVNPRQLKWRDFPIHITIATGLTCTFLAVWAFTVLEQTHTRNTFMAVASKNMSNAVRALAGIRNTEIKLLGYVANTSQDIPLEEFQKQIRLLDYSSVIRYWGWLPRVDGAVREQMEDTLRAEGQTDFGIWTTGADGGREAVEAGRDVYYPLTYASTDEQRFGRYIQSGFDWYSDPMMHQAIDTAATDRLAASSPIMGGEGEEAYAYIVAPVFGDLEETTLIGMLIGIFEPDYFMTFIGYSDFETAAFVDLKFMEVPAAAKVLPEDAAAAVSQWSMIQPIVAWGRTYMMHATPTPLFFKTYSSGFHWLVLMLGLFLTILFVFISRAATRRREILEAWVRRRTKKLNNTIARHDMLDRQNRTFTWMANSNALITAASPAVKDFLGYEPEEVIQKLHTYDFYPKEQRDKIRAAVKAGLPTAAGAALDQYNACVTKDGRLVWIASKVVPVRNKNGGVIGYQGISTDITQQHQADMERARLMHENENMAERYRTILNAANAGAWEQGTGPDAHITLSDEFFRILGYDPAEFEGLNNTPEMDQMWMEMIHPDDRLNTLSSTTAYLENPRAFLQMTIQMRHATGKWVWVLLRSQMVTLPGSQDTKVLMGIILDVSNMKSTEIALRESEAKYRMLTENTRDVFWILDAGTRRFSYISPAVYDLLGFTAAEMSKKTLAEVFSAPESEFFLDEIERKLQNMLDKKMTSNDWFTYTASPLRKDGSLIYTEIVVRYRLNAQTGHMEIHGVARDITRRTQAEQALRESEAQYRLITESMHDLVWVADTETLQYLYVSPSSKRMLGYTPEEMMHFSLQDFIPAEKREDVLELMAKYVKAAIAGTLTAADYSFLELDLKRKDGSIVHTEIIGRYYVNPTTGRTEIHGETRDIAIRKRAEQALRESEEQYRMLAENVKDLVWILDVKTQNFTYISSSVEKLYPSYTADPSVPLHADKVFSAEKRDERLREMQKRSREFQDGKITEGDFFTYMTPITLEDGRILDLESVIHYQRNRQTGEIELSGVSRDISDRKLAERYHDMGVKTLQILNEPKPMNELLQDLVVMFKQVSGVDAAGIRMKSGGIFPFVAHEGYPCGFTDLEDDLSMRDADDRLITDENGRVLLRCACGRVLMENPDGLEDFFTSNGTLWTNDAQRDFAPANHRAPLPTCLASGFSSIALAPIKFHNQTIGLIQLNSFKKNAFTADAILLLDAVAAHVGEAFMRRQAEQDYRTLFHEILESFTVYEVLFDDDGQVYDFRFTAVNPAFERYVNVPADDLLGKTVGDVLPWAMTSTFNAYRMVQYSEKAVYCQHLEETGGRYEELTVFRLSPTQFSVIYNDVTQQTQAELALRESRRQYAALLSNLPGMAYRFQKHKDQNGQERWLLEFISAGSFELTGYTPEELIGHVDLLDNSIISGPYRDLVSRHWQEVLASGQRFVEEHEIKTKSGETKWVWEQGECVFDENGNLHSIEGFVSDISKRKAAEGERERLLQAIEQSRETIIITDNVGKIIYVNAAYTTMMRCTKAEALGTTMPAFAHPEDPHYDDMISTLQADTTWEGHFKTMRQDGTAFDEQVSISPVRDNEGNLAYYVALTRDISDEIHAREERDQLHSQILQANKMESIGRLAGGIAHDFNNMLQAILGYAEMAIEQVSPEQPLYQDIQAIQNAARHSADLTRQLLIFARRQSVTPKVIRLKEAVENMTGILRRLIGTNIQFVWKPGTDDSQIKIDPNQLDQILANLCINARDAIPDKGTITVTTRNVLLEETVHTASGDVAAGMYAMLAVTDTGTGMSKEIMAQIFEPFFTTKKSGKGTGLGLATVYGIVKQCNGGIILHSEQGKGTTFEILLPSETAEEQAAEAGEAQQSSLPRGKETILLVDDEETILHTTRRMLESIGYTVVATTNASDAIKVIQTNQPPIDLLISDVIMPQTNGPDMVHDILKLKPQLPFFFISGYTANLHLERKFAKMPDLLSKPFTRQQIAVKVRNHLDGTTPDAKETN